MARILTGTNRWFYQFDELIGDCEFHCGVIKMTLEDLQGYWDLATPQIIKLDCQFEELAVLENNGWAKPEPKKQKLAKKSIKQVATAGTKKTLAKQSSKYRAFLASKYQSFHHFRGLQKLQKLTKSNQVC
jgi:hypothetical protein